jgi:hypothetical protein
MRSGCEGWPGREKVAQNLNVDWEGTNSKAGIDELGTVNATRAVKGPEMAVLKPASHDMTVSPAEQNNSANALAAAAEQYCES